MLRLLCVCVLVNYKLCPCKLQIQISVLKQKGWFDFIFLTSVKADGPLRIIWKWKVKVASHVRLFVPPWTIQSPWGSLGQNTGVGSLSLLQGIFPTQGSNPGLLHCKWILYQYKQQQKQLNNRIYIKRQPLTLKIGKGRNEEMIMPFLCKLFFRITRLTGLMKGSSSSHENSSH